MPSDRSLRAPRAGDALAGVLRSRAGPAVARRLLSLALFAAPDADAAIGDFQVNAVTTGNQSLPSIAVDLAGNFVVAWQDDRLGTADIFARRFSSSGFGNPLGVIFRVNTTTSGGQYEPQVARDSTGAFVVIWRAFQDGSQRSVHGQRFDSAGAPAGAEFRVNTYTTGNQNYPVVAASPAGSFAVVWASAQTTDPSGGVFLQRFSAAGAPQGPELRVNSVTTGLQERPAVAMTSTGDFVVVWNSQGAIPGIRGQRFSSSGAPVAGEFAIGGAVGVSTRPAVATDLAGGFVVAWENSSDFNDDVFVRRFGSSGAPLSPEARANTFTTGIQDDASIAVFPSGDFVVSWTGLYPQDGAGAAVIAQRFAPGGAPSGPELIVNAYTSNNQSSPAVAPGAGGGFLAVWQSFDQDAPFTSGVYGREEFVGTPVDAEDFRVNTFTTNDQQQGRVAMDPSGSFVVVWQSLGQDGSNNGIFAQAFDDSGAPFGPELRVNTRTLDQQISADAAVLPSGGFVVVWMDVVSGVGDVLLRRFDDGGAPLASELRVNTGTTATQGSPVVAAGPAGFVVVWTDYQFDGSQNVRAQRFDPFAAPLGGELRVNVGGAETTNRDGRVDVAAGAAGFAVAWQRDGGGLDPDEIFARRLDASGLPLGGEFRVHAATTGDQRLPGVAMDGSGAFVVAWQAYQYGTQEDIRARRFAASGSANAAEFRVNTYTSFGQQSPVVAAEPEGGFVVSWLSQLESGPASIVAQRFGRSGAPLRGPFRVNSSTNVPLAHAGSVAFDGGGRFVVIFDSYGPDGSRFGVFRRRFAALVSGDADGNGVVNVSDVLYLINFLFAGGPAPLGEADVNADHATTVSDVLYLINHLFAGGPPPL